MFFHDFSFIITLTKYSHCAIYIDAGVFFPYFCQHIVWFMTRGSPGEDLRCGSVTRGPPLTASTRISPPHTQVHCILHSFSVSVQPVLPTCSPLLDWDPMRLCVCVVVSRHISSFTVFPALTGLHQWALTWKIHGSQHTWFGVTPAECAD